MDLGQVHLSVELTSHDVLFAIHGLSAVCGVKSSVLCPAGRYSSSDAAFHNIVCKVSFKTTLMSEGHQMSGGHSLEVGRCLGVTSCLDDTSSILEPSILQIINII